VRALTYYPSIPRYFAARAAGRRFPVGLLPLRLGETPAPEAPAAWERVRIRGCGVCGTDLALLLGKSSPRLSPFFSFPAILGHEILGEVDGTRVAVDPLLACRERSLPPCPACAAGDDPRCANVAEGALAPGMIGFCASVPGGWSEETVAHPARLHPIPGDVPDERAVLAEPLAVAVHGLAAVGAAVHNVLIVGAGTIGLCALAALRGSGCPARIHVLARRPRQAQLARELGAEAVHRSADEARAAGGGKSYRAIVGPPAHRGGYDLVVDAAGSASSLETAAWLAKEGGAVLLLGGPGRQMHDMIPHWFREVRLVGGYAYRPADFSRAVALLPEAKGLEGLVGARFGLADWRGALRAAIWRSAVKVVFAPA
jgi:threonine dehydrogenase-like Zn-dependent dehydrogenase